MTALHPDGAGDGPCGRARNGARRVVYRTGAMMTVLVAVASLSVTGYACLLAVYRQHVRVADSRRVVSGISALVSSRAFVALSGAGQAASASAAPGAGKASSSSETTGASPAGAATGALALTASERRDCPAAAAACVDLAGEITWLQAAGKVTYGPVRMQPGPPGAPHATRAGTFRVTGNAGPGYLGTAYHHLTPWPVFYAPGGIAFCAGNLGQPSDDGCVDLTLAAARFYRQHLPDGAEVVVFLG
jgi:hypothetical protein